MSQESTILHLVEPGQQASSVAAMKPIFTPEKAEELLAKCRALEARAEDEKPPAMCAICGDTKWEHVEGNGVRRCECYWRELALKKLAAIPTGHQHVQWKTLAPDVERFTGMPHGKSLIEMQQRNITQIKQEPDKSYFLWGATGLGKSALLYAIYRRAVGKRMPAYAFTLSDYLADMREVAFGQDATYHVSDRFDVSVLYQKERRVCVCIDEVSSPGTRPTMFAAEQLRKLIDAVINWGPAGGHQLIVTSNYSADDLGAFWSQESAAGFAAVRRMLEGAVELEFN